MHCLPRSPAVPGLFASLFALLAGPAHAIVNMEDLHLGATDEGFNGELAVNASGASGNTDKSDLGIGTRLQWRVAQHTNFLVFDYAYGRSQGQTNANKAFLHARHIYQATPALAWEGFLQSERNEFTRLSFRGLGGGGARWTLFEVTEKGAAFLGTGAFYVHETLTKTANLAEDRSDNAWRGNLYLVVKVQFLEGVSLVNSLYYQPDLSEFSDYRLLETAALRVKMSDRLALQLSLTAAHDSRPPQGVEKTDFNYRTSLTYSF